MSIIKIERDLIKKYRKVLWTPFIKAIKDYKLISDGDKIAVAISGGKDSFVLAKLFQELYKHGNRNFELEFICMDPGYSKENLDRIIYNAELMNIPVNIFNAPVFNIVSEKTDKPCYLCAKMRRGYLYSKAKELGCNKIALGHHYDDVIETVLMNVLSSGTYMTMMPKLKSKNFEGMELIRPMYYIRENDIIRYRDSCDIEFLDCACEATKREEGTNRKRIKELIASLKKDFPQVEASIFSSATNVHLGAILGWREDEKNHSFLEKY